MSEKHPLPWKAYESPKSAHYQWSVFDATGAVVAIGMNEHAATKIESAVNATHHTAIAIDMLGELRADVLNALATRDTTIAALRAEVERLKKQKKYFSSECVRKGTEILRLSVANADANAELTQLREDRRVLGAEVRSWRYQCVQENTEGGDVDGATCMVNAAMEATDSSKALERANG